jgi:hypothetical protein
MRSSFAEAFIWINRLENCRLHHTRMIHILCISPIPDFHLILALELPPHLYCLVLYLRKHEQRRRIMDGTQGMEQQRHYR